MSSVLLLLSFCEIVTQSKRITPFWKWSWDTLPVWASGQGGSSPTGFPTESIDLYTKYPLMWTQGALTLNGHVKGYENWEQGTISDAEKIHNVSPNEPVFGYYGFQGCCLSHYAEWYTLYQNRSDLWLRDDNNKVCIWNVDGPPNTAFFDLCNPDFLPFYYDNILSPFMSSTQITGLFFDETDAFVEGPQALWLPNPYNGNVGYHFSTQRQKELQQCYQNAMVNITKYISSFNKWIIPSSYSLSKQSTKWETAMDNALIQYGGFRYIEYLECWGTGQIYNITDNNKWQQVIETQGFGTDEWNDLLSTSSVESVERGIDGSFDCYAYNTVNECCQDMILTSMNVAKQGVPIMIRAQQNRNEYAQRYYATAAFLLMAYEYSYFAGGNGWDGTKSFPWFDIYNYPIGEPQQDTQMNKEQTIFSRHFKNVYVSFNLSQGVSALYFNWNA